MVEKLVGMSVWMKVETTADSLVVVLDISKAEKLADVKVLQLVAPRAVG